MAIQGSEYVKTNALETVKFDQRSNAPMFTGRGIAAVDGVRPEMVRFLLERGADPTIEENNWNDTPLGWAEWGGNEEIIQMLREAAKTD